LIRQEQDAEDVAQEALLRAWKFFDTFRGGDSRAWLLTIVRRTCYTWLHQHQAQTLNTEAFDEELHQGSSAPMNPETLLLSHGQQQLLHHALSALPVEFREVIVLRELEELSYKDIAAITALPIGTVMSRLARARARLQAHVARQHQTEAARGL
jgi:RNA polymerase sigma-70 factor (ECF subfamily)